VNRIPIWISTKPAVDGFQLVNEGKTVQKRTTHRVFLHFERAVKPAVIGLAELAGESFQPPVGSRIVISHRR